MNSARPSIDGFEPFDSRLSHEQQRLLRAIELRYLRYVSTGRGQMAHGAAAVGLIVYRALVTGLAIDPIESAPGALGD